MFSTKDDLPAKLGQLKDKASEAVKTYGPIAAEAAGTAREKVAPAAGRAAETVKTYAPVARDVAIEKAHQAAEYAGPALEAARDKAQPYVEAAWDRARPHVEHGVSVAAPKVQSAVEGLSPKVDAAHDTIVDEWLPKLAGMVSSVAAGAQQASHTAMEQAQLARANAPEAFAVLRGESSASPMRTPKKGGGKLLIAVGLVAGAAAVAAVLTRKPAQPDPWAAPADSTAWDTSHDKAAADADQVAEDVKDKAAEVKDDVADQAEELKDKAGEVKDDLADTADDAKDKVEDIADDVQDKAADVADDVKDKAEDVKPD